MANNRSQNLTYLLTLLNKLTEVEIRVVSQFFEFHHDDPDARPMELLQKILWMLQSGTAEEVQHQLEENNDLRELSNLTSRIIALIHESLILDANLRRKNNYQNLTLASLEINKRILYVRVLWGKGVMDKIPGMLDRMEKKARRYELYEELIRILYIKQEFWGLRKGLSYYREIGEEIEQFETTLRALRSGRRQCQMLALMNEEKGDKFNMLEESKTVLRTIKKDGKEYPSSLLRYYQGLVEIEYRQQQRNYTRAAEVCADLVDLVKNKPMIFSRKRLSVVYLQLANNHLMSHNFLAAQGSVEQVTRLLPEKDFNRSVALEIEFLSLFYDGNYEHAEVVWRCMQRAREPYVSEQQQQRWQYFHAALCLQTGRTPEAMQSIESLSLLKADKEGWNIGLRYFRFLAALEAGDTNALEKEAVNFRRHLAALKRRRKLRRRWELIGNVVSALHRNGFELERTLKSAGKDLRRLAAASGETAFEIRSPEMIDFYLWLRARCPQLAA